MADIDRRGPASALREAGMGGNESHQQVHPLCIGFNCRMGDICFMCFCFVTLQLCSYFLASRLAPICGKHICWFQGLIATSKCHDDLFQLQKQSGWFLLTALMSLSVQDIPFFFTLQNSSHVVSFTIAKVVHREVSAFTACCM